MESLDTNKQKLALILVLRFLQSPRNDSDRDGGSAGLAAILRSEEFLINLSAALAEEAKVVRAGSYTYRAVITKWDLGFGLGGLLEELMVVFEKTFPTLLQVRELISRKLNSQLPFPSRRKFSFTTLQIALDLYQLGLINVYDEGQSCPLACGSTEGIPPVAVCCLYAMLCSFGVCNVVFTIFTFHCLRLDVE